MTEPDARKLFAEFGVRMAAVVIDVFVALLFMSIVIDPVLGDIGLTDTATQFTVLAILFLYFPAFWVSLLRATPVQFLFGLRVIDKTGEKLGFGRAVLRSIALITLIVTTLTLYKIAANPYFSIVALLGLAALFLAAITPDRQAAHDLLSGSIVVNKIVLKSAEHFDQLKEHLSDSAPDSGRQRRPPITSIFGNLFVLGVPTFLILFVSQTSTDLDMRQRTNYALEGVTYMQAAVEEAYEYYGRWPINEHELAAPMRAD